MRKNLIPIILVALFIILSILLANHDKTVTITDDSVSANERDQVEKAYLSSVGDQEGFGYARRLYTGSSFVHTLNVNLPKTEDGQYKEVLINDLNGDRVATSELLNIGDEYVLVYESIRDLREYKKIEIQRVGDEKTETVLVGSF